MTKSKDNAAGVLPPTGAGLIRYFDEDTEGIKISPRTVVISIVAFGIIFIALHIVR
ncbi:MAG: preprotein translocase subunit Sec61beta [Candidatus Methanofastidiosia archaeon]